MGLVYQRLVRETAARERHDEDGRSSLVVSTGRASTRDPVQSHPPIPGATERALRDVLSMVTGRITTQTILVVSAFRNPRVLGANHYGQYAAIFAVVVMAHVISELGFPIIEVRFLGQGQGWLHTGARLRGPAAALQPSMEQLPAVRVLAFTLDELQRLNRVRQSVLRLRPYSVVSLPSSGYVLSSGLRRAPRDA